MCIKLAVYCTFVEIPVTSCIVRRFLRDQKSITELLINYEVNDFRNEVSF